MRKIGLLMVGLFVYLTHSAMASPTNVTGLILWLDADDPVTVLTNGAGTVTNWLDKSPQNNHAVNTAGNNINISALQQNGRTLIKFPFNGGNVSHLDFTSNVVAQGSTVFIMFRQYNPASWLNPLHSAPGVCCTPVCGNHLHMIHANDTRCLQKGCGNQNLFSTYPANAWHIQVMQLALGDYRLWLDGNLIGPSGSTQIMDPFADVGNVDGDFAEVIIYNRTLTLSEQNVVGAYLESKYGLATAYIDPALPDVVPQNANRINMADNVTADTVDVVGNVISTGTSSTAVSLLYGTNDPGAVLTGWDTTNLNFTAASVGLITNTLTNLTAGTKYFFRYYSTNAAGTNIMGGSPGVFVTAGTGAPPLAVTNGLVVRFDASFLNLNNGDPVCVWPNLVPNELSAVQNNAAEQPVFSTTALNGRPAVSFNNAAGGDLMLQDDFAGLFTTEATIFVVGDINNAHNYSLFTTRENDPRWRENRYGRMGTFRTGRVNYQNNEMPTIGSHIFTIESSASNWELWLNGISQGSMAAQFNAGGGFKNAIGGRTQDGQQRLNGDIAEILIYNRVLTLDEKNAIGRYLETKYGLLTDYQDPGLPVVFPAFPDRANMADNVTSTNVDVVGNVVSTGSSAAVVSLLYDTVDQGTNANSWSFTNLMFTAVNVGLITNALTNLTAGTKYFFRYFSTNMSGSTVMGGRPGTFVTASPGTPMTVISNGLVVWFDATALNLTHGDPVCIWPNQVPLDFPAAQHDPNQQPIYSTNGLNGRPAVCFNPGFGGDVLLQEDFASMFTTGATVFVVAQITGSQNYNLFETRENDPRWREGVNTRPGTFRNGRVNAGGDLMPIDGAHIYQIDSSTGGWQMFLNGASIATAGADFNAGAGFQNVLGGRTQDAGQRLNGCMAEIMIYDRALSADERNFVGDYLEAKYGLDTVYLNPADPEINNQPATGITTNAAVLNGDLTATGLSATVVTAYWGPTDGGTNPASWLNSMVIGTPPIGPLSAPVGGLLENTAYYFRFAASNASATVWAEPSLSFNTDLISTNFTRRLKVQFCGYDHAETLTNFPVAIRLSTNIQGFSYADFTSGSGGDLRLSDGNGYDALDFEIESWDTNGESVVWVELPALANSDQCIWLYWGHANAALPPSSTNGSVWSDNYIGVWHMAEMNTPDASGNGHHGTAVGTVTPVTGQINGGNDFNQDVDYITVPDSADFNLTGDYTVSAWIRSDAIGNQDEAIIGTYNGSGFIFSLQNNAQNTLRFWAAGQWRASGVAIPDGEWKNVVYSRQGTDGRFYVDGELVSVIANAVAGNNGGALHLGAGGTSWAGQRFDGFVDEVRLSGARHSPGWIWATYENTRTNSSFLCFSQVDSTLAPQVANTGGATAITTNRATLNGELLDDGGSGTDVRIYYGQTDGGFVTSAWSNVVFMGPRTVGPLSSNVPGLLGDTDYFYRTYASNAAGDTWAMHAVLFRTLGPPRVENEVGATGIGVARATLNGAYQNLNRGDVTIYWGSFDGSTNKLAWENTVSLGSVTTETFAVTVTSTWAGIGYYYRVYASNGLGDGWASTSVAFKTDGPLIPGTTEGLRARAFDTLNNQNLLAPISQLQGQPDNGTSLQVNDLSYNGNFVAGFAGITDGNTFMMLWEGIFVPDGGAGTYTFGLDSDDRSVIYLDLNHDGDFDDPEDYFLDRPCCGTTFSTVVLEDRPYRIAIGFHENGGGERITARWKFGNQSSYGVLDVIDGTSGAFFPPNENAVNIVNTGAIDITTNTATIQAVLTSPLTVSYVQAYWGTTDGGTNPLAWDQSASVGVFTNESGLAISHAIAGLVQGSNYFYTFGGTNCLTDTMAQPSFEFGTVSGPPMVDNGGGATNIGVGTATLQGTLLAGGSARVTIFWGDSDGGTDLAAWDDAASFTLPAEGPFSVDATEFLFGIPYFYRAYASNVFGFAWATSTIRFKTEAPVGGGNMEAYWDFNAKMGTTVEDLVDGFHDGTLVGGADITTGNMGYNGGEAMVLTGNGQYLDAASPSTFNFNTSFTWHAYIKTTDNSGAVFSRNPDAVAWNRGSKAFFVRNRAGLGELEWDTGWVSNPRTFTAVNDDAWHQVVAVYDVNTDLLQMYIDGVLGFNAAHNVNAFDEHAPGAPGPAIADTSFTVGAADFSGGLASLDTLVGLIDEAAIFATNLSASELSILFTDGPRAFADTAELNNLAASGITSNEAVLNGELFATGSVQCVDLFWGMNDGGTNAFAWSNKISISCFSNVSMTNLSRLVTGLQANTTYFYTYRATNCLETIWAEPSLSFMTPLDLADFAHRTKITFCGYDKPETLVNYPALILLGSNINNFAYSDFQFGGTDLRFTDGSRTVELNYEVELWDTNGTSYVWVQVPQLIDSNTCIYAFWGNASAVTFPSYTTNGATWNSDFAAVYHLNNDENDSSPNRFDGVNVNASNTLGQVADGQHFDGVDDYIDVPLPGTLYPLVTYSTWFNLNSIPANLDSIIHDDVWSAGAVHYFFNGGFPEFAVNGNNPVQPRANTAFGAGDIGQWVHIVAAYDAAADIIQFYRNGQADGMTTYATANDIRLGPANIASWNASRYLDGKLDEFRISTTIRSTNWVWASWYNVASNDSFICYDAPPVLTGAVEIVLSKTASTNNLLIGTNLVYTIDIMNIGTQWAGGLVVTDSLPAGVKYLFATPAATETNGGDYGFSLGFLPNGASTSIVITVAVTSSVIGSITNFAHASVTNQESSLANNSDTAVTALPDSDGDGIANPGDPDDDNDLFPDTAEEIANTNPLDPTSYLWIRIMRTGMQPIQDLTFPTSTGRTYRIQSTTNLYVGPWVDVRSNIPGTGLNQVIPDTNVINRLYYRVGVESP